MNDVLQFLGCAVCRSDPGSTINQATNGAVFVMFGVMAVVFGGLLSVAISFIRKQRAIGRGRAQRDGIAPLTGQSA